MILLGNNKILQSMVTITGGNSSLGADRMLNQIGDEVTQFNDNIVIDFGSAVDITAIGVVNVSANVTIEANTTDTWTTPAYTATLASITGSRCRVEVPTSTQTYRYWRLKASGLTYVGHFYLGEYTAIPGRVFGNLPDLKRFDSDTSGVGGVSLTKKGYSRKDLSVTLAYCEDTELDTLRTYWNDNGKFPVIVIPFEEDVQTTLKEVFTPFFCKPTFTFGGRNNVNDNNVDIDLIETK
jgi:hypothetical protein